MQQHRGSHAGRPERSLHEWFNHKFRVRDGIRSDRKLAEVEEILDPSIVLLLGPLVPLWSSVDLPNCGVLLGNEVDRKTEKEEGNSAGGVKLRGGSVCRTNHLCQVRWVVVVSGFTASGLPSNQAPDGLFWFH